MNDGQVQAYFSDAAMAEITYQTSGVTADVSAGGVRINMIPKDGGNRFSGSGVRRRHRRRLAGDNVTDELRARGLTHRDRASPRSATSTSASAARSRRTSCGSSRAGAASPPTRSFRAATSRARRNRHRRRGSVDPEPDGPPDLADQPEEQVQRLPRPLSEVQRARGIAGAITEWDTAAGRRDPQHALYYTGQAKWTSTVTQPAAARSRLLDQRRVPDIAAISPAFRRSAARRSGSRTIGKSDLIYAAARMTAAARRPTASTRRPTPSPGMLSYVTGSHALKTGVQWTFGDYVLEYDINGDLVQLYRNGVPDSVRVYNTPVRANEYLNAQPRDVRAGCLDAEAHDAEHGRALRALQRRRSRTRPPAPAASRRSAPSPKSTTCPSWFDIAPRLGVSYDLFGNAQTALKATLRQVHGRPDARLPAALQPAAAPERHAHLARHRTATTSRRTARSARATTPRSACRSRRCGPTPDIKREYDLEYTAPGPARGRPGPVGERRLLPPRHLQLSAAPRTTAGRRPTTRSSTSSARSTARSCPVYNLDPAKRGNVDRIDFNSTDSDLRRRTYNGVQLGFNARVRGAQFFGGWTIDRIIDVRCDAIESNQARYAGTAAIAANNAPQPDYHFCDQSQLDMPFLHEFKLAGSYTLPWWGIQANVAFQSYNGQPLFTRWNIAPTTRYAANCTGPCRPGRTGRPEHDAGELRRSISWRPARSTTQRQNQFDIGFRKTVPLRQVPALGAGRHLQHRQLVAT